MKLILTTLLLCSFVGWGTVNADVLLLEGINATSNIKKPVRGASMSKVEAQYGAPAKKHNAVGEPPITRWDYAKFSVYFENHLVLTSVAKR